MSLRVQHGTCIAPACPLGVTGRRTAQPCPGPLLPLKADIPLSCDHVGYRPQAVLSWHFAAKGRQRRTSAAGFFDFWRAWVVKAKKVLMLFIEFADLIDDGPRQLLNDHPVVFHRFGKKAPDRRRHHRHHVHRRQQRRLLQRLSIRQ
jgi:hypothetical protein